MAEHHNYPLAEFEPAMDRAAAPGAPSSPSNRALTDVTAVVSCRRRCSVGCGCGVVAKCSGRDLCRPGGPGSALATALCADGHCLFLVYEHHSAYQEVGTYRGAAELCGTPHKTVKR